VIVMYRYRVKSLTGLLNKRAKAVNFVWNFCNDTQKHALKWDKKWPSAYDLQKLCAGAGEELGLRSAAIHRVCEQYAQSLRQSRKPYLRYRGKRSLGWIPIKALGTRETLHGFHLHGNEFRVFKSRPLPAGSRIRDGGSFARDARGNWFLNIAVEIPEAPAKNIENAVGVDLGLKDLATLSTGEKVANPTHYRKLETRLARAQRARKKKQVAKIHANIVNARGDHLHKTALSIVRRFDYIAVGNVNAASLAKTSMAKSVHDAAWSSFRAMLAYKSIANGAKYQEVNEAYSTQTCSCCGALPLGRPKGIAGLGIREWTCDDCGTVHDRDVNAARNILARGLASLAEGAASGRSSQ
jgi:putative transposase